MKILLVHNYYGSTAPSGENMVVGAELALLRSRGHRVSEFSRTSDEIRSTGALGMVQGALATPWNPWAKRAISSEITTKGADVMHVHNTFPLLSPSVFYGAARCARVLTLHNYRLFCPAAIPLRQGNVCTACIDSRSVLPSLWHRCYRGSALATAPIAVNVALHRLMSTWHTEVDAFIALSDFQADLMVAGGLPKSRVFVKPNFYPGRPSPVAWESRRASVVFVGRLSEEKGVRTLLEAWSHWGSGAPELRIVGTGPLQEELEKQAAGSPVTFLGQLQPEAAQKEIADARLLVLPSEWFEGFPMAVREAFAFGTPAAVSNLGPLPSIVTQGVSGVVFPPRNSQALLDSVRAVWTAPNVLERLGAGARRAFEAKYNEDANYETLMHIYDQAIENSKRRFA